MSAWVSGPAGLVVADWDPIEACLPENERLLRVKTEGLLMADNVRLPPSQVYRKVVVMSILPF